MAITYGLDLLSSTSYAYTTDYGGYFETPLYTVGSANQPFKFTEVEFQFVRPLRTGEGIKIEYRDDLTATYTTLGIWTYTTWGAVVSKNLNILTTSTNFPAYETIQFRISLLGSSTTSPELKSITFR